MKQGAAAGAPLAAPDYRPAAALALVSGYAVLSSANGVISAALLQQTDLAAFTFLGFLGTAIFFNLLRTLGPAARHAWSTPQRRDMAWLNATTAGSWLLMYGAYANMEPAVAATLMCSVGPFVALAFDTQAGKTAHAARRYALAAAFLQGAVILMYGCLSGQSAVAGYAPLRLAGGIGAALGCGYFMTASTVYLKRLSAAGVATAHIMSHRFYLLLAVSGAGALWLGTLVPTAQAQGVTIVLLACAGIIAPLFVLQRGIALGTPYLTMVVMAAAPLFTALLQLADHRLTLSMVSLAGVLISVAASCIAVRLLLQGRH